MTLALSCCRGSSSGGGSPGTRRPGAGPRSALRHPVCLGKLPHSQVKTEVPTWLMTLAPLSWALGCVLVKSQKIRRQAARRTANTCSCSCSTLCAST